MDTVEELEGGTGGEESDGAANDGLIVSVEVSDEAREDEEDTAHERHEGGAKKNSDIARIAGGERVATADGLAYANGGGRGNAQRNHIGEGDSVESDLVAGERNGTQPRNERSNESENGDFGGELESRGKTEGNELADTLEIGLNGSF